MLDRSQTHGLLAWMRVPHVGERSLQQLLAYARGVRLSLAELWEVPAADLTQLVRLHPRAVTALQERASDFWDEAAADGDALWAHGLEALVPTDPAYPPRLRASERPWPALFACGALDLLEEPLVAVVNSADASAEALALTDSLADELARRDAPLVASSSKEGYRAVAVAAKRQAAPAVLALDRGLLSAFPSGPGREPVAAARVWSPELDPETQLLLSPFPPRAPWTNRNGTRRDALVCDLASVVLALDVRPGGTMEKECRRAARRGTRVLAVDRGPATAEGTRRLWEDGAAERVLPDRAAGEATRDRAPAEFDPEARRAGWLAEVARLLPALALAGARGRRLREVAVHPPRGALRAAAEPGPLGTLLERAPGAGELDLALAEFPSGQAEKALELVRRLRPGGILAARLPAAWLADEGRAEWRRTLLELGAPRLILHLPEPAPPAGAPGEAEAVLLFERGRAPRAEVPVLSPERARLTRAELRRYLRQGLAVVGE